MFDTEFKFPFKAHEVSMGQLIQIAANVAKDLLKRGDFRVYVSCDRRIVKFKVHSYFEMSDEDVITHRRYIDLLFNTAFCTIRLNESKRLLKRTPSTL